MQSTGSCELRKNKIITVLKSEDHSQLNSLNQMNADRQLYLQMLAPTHPLADRVRRAVWNAVWLILFRPSPKILHVWRRFLLRRFGAQIGSSCRIYPSARIWAPWNLKCGDIVAIADGAEIYNTSLVTIDHLAVISQNAFLCCGTHDYKSINFDFKSFPIHVHRKAWVAARAVILPGVVIGESAVVGAMAVVNSNVRPFTVVAGNPAVEVKKYEYVVN